MGQTQAPARLGIGIIGAGRVGLALGSALRANGHAIVGVNARSSASQERAEEFLPQVPQLSVDLIVERSELVLLAVPDDALAELVTSLATRKAWHAGQLVVHTSGRYGISVLRPAQESGAIPLALHPAMTFTGTSHDVPRLQGCPFGVTAPPIALPIVQALAVELGGEPFVVQEADRALYHAALSHGANHLVTLVTQARNILRAIGMSDPSAILAPLLHAALDNALSTGAAALTGPVRRGDIATVRDHVRGLRHVVQDAGEYLAPEVGSHPSNHESGLETWVRPHTPLSRDNEPVPADALQDALETYIALMHATARLSAREGYLTANAAQAFHDIEKAPDE